MKPNNLGGMTYEGAEIPVVIAAAAHQHAEFADWLTEEAARQLHQRQMAAAGVNILDFNAWFNFQIMDKSTLDVMPELELGPTQTTMTYGNITESLEAGLVPLQQRPVARGVLIEAGLIEPTEADLVEAAKSKKVAKQGIVRRLLSRKDK